MCETNLYNLYSDNFPKHLSQLSSLMSSAAYSIDTLISLSAARGVVWMTVCVHMCHSPHNANNLIL